MGLISNMIYDISNIGSYRNKYSKHFSMILSLLTDYSFNDLSYSNSIAQNKINAEIGILEDMAAKFSNNETIRFYMDLTPFDLTIDQTLKIVEVLKNEVFNNKTKITKYVFKNFFDNIVY